MAVGMEAAIASELRETAANDEAASSSAEEANESPMRMLAEASSEDEGRSGSAELGDEFGDGESDSEAEAGAEDEEGPFKSGAKGQSVARAFAKVLESTKPDDSGRAILSKSKSVVKRRREEQAAEQTDKVAKTMRLEMRRRGHVAVPKRGQDPAQDAAEKLLLKTATKGVVRLFNAVSKAQKDQKEAKAFKSKAATLSKASFLAELKGQPARPVQLSSGGLIPQAPAPQPQPASSDDDDEDGGSREPGWDVLRSNYSGLQVASKMKDWDKQEDSDDAVVEQMDDVSDSASDGGVW